MKKQTSIKRLFSAVILLMLALQTHAVVGAGEYYIVNNFWGKLLTSNSDREPRLMAYDSSDDARFLFVAEASGTSGYVKLRHKSTGTLSDRQHLQHVERAALCQWQRR